ncbi:hypothetical protein [uncultured Algoriphagus sp.]|jgi:hypothetical protein|uniref:hypothetical protein n=2 Tax=Algoriphagus TaxID=246875 RepID=UPI0010670E2A|nr:hypothetical protein [uncultured Algoriphagus sp.]
MKFFLLLAFLLITAIPSMACECMFVESMQEQFDRADLVFYAKVTEIRDPQTKGFKDSPIYMMDSTYAEKAGYFPTFTVIKKYKGKVKKGHDIRLHSSWSSCDTSFLKDTEYVVFAYYDPQGRVRTSMCVPNTKITDPKQLEAFKKLR